LTLNAEEWERDFEQQEKWIREGMAALADAHPDSEEFRSLPVEIQHEILHEIKERNKYHSLTKLTQMPEDSDSFSSYQLKKLMKQSKLSSRIEHVRKEMSTKSAADLTYSMGDDYYGDEVESRKIMSEDAAHYVLIKGLSKRKQEEEADKYELQNRVKIEKVDEDNKFGISNNKSEKSTPLNYEEPELMSTSSDSDSGIETFVAKHKNQQPSKKPVSKQLTSRHRKRQPLKRPSTDSHKNNSPVQLKDDITDSEDEFIEVKIDPHAAMVEDELFPSSIFQTTDQPEVTEQVEFDDLPYKKREYTNATDTLGLGQQETLPSENLTDVNKSSVVSREIIAVSNEIIAKRKSILDDIRSLLEKKRESLPTAADEANGGAQTLVPKTCTDVTADDLDYSTSGGFFHEESSEDDTSDGLIENIEADDGGLDRDTISASVVSRSPLSSSTEASSAMCDDIGMPGPKSQSSEGEDDLQLAIELSLQTAQHESVSIANDHGIDLQQQNVLVTEGKEKNKLPDVDECSDHSTESSLSLIHPKQDSVDKNSDSSSFTGHITRVCPDKSLPESISPTKSVSRPQPEDLDADDPGETFHAFSEEALFNLNSYLNSERQALMSEQGKQNRMATSVTEQINQEAQELLRLFGIPYVVSPMEAEAQCAFLDITSQTEGTITDDSDIWLFGGRRMYKNFFNQSLSRDQLINLALLCGSDYTEGIQGVGPVRALEIMAEFPGDGLDGLKMFRKWWEKAKKKASSESKLRNRLKELKLNSGFPSEAVVWAYLNPKVDESKERFTWRLPEVDLLREFAKIKFGWPKEKTDQALLPMMKQLTQKNIREEFPHTFNLKISYRLRKLKVREEQASRKKAKVGQNAEESEQHMSGPAKKKSKSQKVIKIQKKVKNTSGKNTLDVSVSASETCSIEGMATDETADNFMDPKTGPALGEMLVSLDQAKAHKVCGRKVANKGKAIKSGAINLSESSSCSEIESDDQRNSLVSEADEMNDVRNLKPHIFTKIVEGSLNKQPERFQSTQNNIEGLQSDQQLLKSCNETDPQTTRKMSYSEDLSQGILKAASSMPAALAASMKKVNGLEGGQILNAVERRMEADEKKTKVNVHSSSSTDALTFEDLLEKMDTAATETQRFNKKRSLYISEYSHAAQEKTKRIENKIEMVKTSKKVESPPIGEINDDFSSTKKSGKKNKFRQQLKHLNDTRSIRGHGILPYSGKNEFIKGNAFVGKGKGRGKNTQEVSPSTDEKDNEGYGQGLNEHETLTEADLGSDFSECDF
ncbi:hypothetical protein Btru_038222, partial [Bulinus truncatus]